MRVLQILPSPIRGGAEEYALSMSSGFRENGFEVHAAFPLRAETRDLVEDYMKLGVNFHSLEIPGNQRDSLSVWRHFFRTIVLLCRLRPDVVHLVVPWPKQCRGSLFACAFLGVRTVVVFQLVMRQAPLRWFMRKFYALARQRKQKWIAISENNQRCLSEIFSVSEKDIRVVYNGPCLIDDKEGSLFKESATEARKEICINANSTVVLTVGRLAYQKGYDLLIEQIPRIIEKYPNVTFVWVGEGELRSEYEAALRKNRVENFVKILGYRKDIPALLSAADIFLFPTRFEGGSSIALLEAMVAGVPVVTSDASGIPEVITDRVNGVLFKSEDSQSLASALEWSLNQKDALAQMAENAKLRAKEFSSEKSIRETVELLVQ